MKRANKFIISTLLLLLILAVFSACTPRTPVYSLRYLADTGGYISGNANQSVSAGGSGEVVVAIPNEGYKFLMWSDGLQTAQRQDKDITSNIQFVAVFSKISQNTEKEKYTLTYSANSGGRIEGKTSQSVTEGSDGETVTAIPDEGYKFVRWDDGITTAERKDKLVSGNKEVAAVFAVLEKFTLNYTSNEFGSVEGECEQTVTEGQSGLTVKAVPKEGYIFVEWSDHETAPVRQDVNVFCNKTVTAIFREKKTFEITYELNPYRGYFALTSDGFSEYTWHKQVKEGDTAEPVTAYAHEGCEFIGWSDGVTTQTRQDENVTSNKKVTANFKVNYFIFEYVACEGGHIEGNTRQIVYPDADGMGTGTSVTAVPDEGYLFSRWKMFGMYEPTRTDRYNRSEKNYAIFEKGINVTYEVYKGIGGRIEGETTQLIRKGTDASPVIAIPDEGYVFAGWSDFALTSERQDKQLNKDIVRTAIFELKGKTFNYDYNGATNRPADSTVSITDADPKAAVFAVPQKEGYTFGGWYADKDYNVKVTNENGRLMLGRYTVLLDTDTLYARWIDPADTTVVYKALMVVVDEIDAEFTMVGHEDDPIDIDYKMNHLEMRICQRVIDRMRQYLNEWFEGEVRFEVDTYFTLDPVGPYGFYNSSYKDLYIIGHRIEEISDLLNDYGSILTLFNIDDYNGDLTRASGAASGKHAFIHLEKFYDRLYKYTQYDFVRLMEDTRYELNYWTTHVETCLHEFTHTVEEQCDFSAEQRFHYVIYGDYFLDYNNDGIKIIRMYLKHEVILNGNSVGIPKSFWIERKWQNNRLK